jgi:uncharacterized protein (TIGR00299 family) protein
LTVTLMNPNIERRIMIVDCQLAGISGDMIVAALLDLGANPEKVMNAIRNVSGHISDCERIDVNISETIRSGFRAKQVKITSYETEEHRSGSELINAISDSARVLRLSPEAQDFAMKSIKTLVETEARLHGKSTERAVLHEAGSADTVADIIGTATALDDLGMLQNTRIYSTPVAVGGGLLRISHGIVSSPAPATLQILTEKKFSILGGPLDFELSTPTGVSILTSLAEKSLTCLPAMSPEAVGYGAGMKNFDAVPNILRIIIGKTSEADNQDKVVLLETNVDDVTGEVIGYTTERLFSAGAKDVSIIPIFQKKSRPGWIISVVSAEKDADLLTEILTSETGTLGVRIHSCHRKILDRENKKIELNIAGVKTEVSVKVARDQQGRIVNLKPEYDEVRDLALRLGKPFREIHEAAMQKAKDLLLV